MKWTISRVPQPGDVASSNVEILQNALNEIAGTSLTVDGNYGPKTRSAVSKFQIDLGLSGSGVVGEKTLAALDITVVSTIAPPINKDITRETIANKIVDIILKDILNNLRETNGKNRSPRIDEFNQRVGAPLGSPYCASAGWCAIDDACKELGLQNPVPRTASSQAFRNSSFVKPKYIRPDGSLGMKGDVGVLQVVGDSSHGHYTTVYKDQTKQPLFATVEYNTDGSGSRDGDGAYQMLRSTIDRSPTNSGKIFVCFTDTPQWILDFNNIESVKN